MHRPPRSRLRALLLLVVVLIAFSGCKIRQDVVFNDDGSGTFTYLVGLEKDLLERLDADPYASIKRQVDEGNFPVTLERYETDDLSGFELTFEFESVDDLKDKLNVDDPGSVGQQTLQELTIDSDEDGWDLRGVVGAPDLSSGQELPIDVSALQEKLDMQFSIALPGEAAANNADDVREGDESSTFTWTLAPGQAGLEIAAATETDSGSFPVLLVVGAGVAALAIVGMLWALLRRHRRRATSSGH